MSARWRNGARLRRRSTEKRVTDKQIAAVMNLDLTGQRVNQICSTVAELGEFMDDNIAFEVYNLARQMNKGKPRPRRGGGNG
jgi:hypothetical protein